MSIYHSDIQPDGKPTYGDQSVVFHNKVKIGTVESYMVGATQHRNHPNRPITASVTMQFYKDGGTDGINLFYEHFKTIDEAVDAIRAFKILQVSEVHS